MAAISSSLHENPKATANNKSEALIIDSFVDVLPFTFFTPPLATSSSLAWHLFTFSSIINQRFVIGFGICYLQHMFRLLA